MKLLIDGYNLFKNIFKKSDLTLQEKDSLLKKLITYAEKKQLLTYIVFDGGELPSRYVERYQQTTVIYAGSYKKADPIIIDMMSELQGEIILVTSDRELINKARSYRIEVVPPLLFENVFTSQKNESSEKRRLKNKPVKLSDSEASSIDSLMEESMNMIVEKHEESKPILPNNSNTDKRIMHLLKRLSL